MSQNGRIGGIGLYNIQLKLSVYDVLGDRRNQRNRPQNPNMSLRLGLFNWLEIGYGRPFAMNSISMT